MQALSAWENFYIVVGSSGGALIGLTFVVITVISAAPVRSRNTGLGAFTTPTIVHFSVVLMVAAVLSAPWQAIEPPAIVLGLAGVGGLVYSVIVMRRVRSVENYEPVQEDWLWYVICPFVSYAALVVAAALLPGDATQALFVVAAALLALLFLGIRNAWDVVTYLATEVLPQQREKEEK